MNNTDEYFRPSVCIDAVLGEKSISAATKIVQDSGLTAFEFWGWWDKDFNELLAAKDNTGLAISACCTKFISLVDPALRDIPDSRRGVGGPAPPPSRKGSR